MVVAAATFIVAFILEWLARSIHKLSHRHKAPIMLRVSTDKEAAWAERGRRLAGFRVKREPRPSEWLVTLYLGRLIVRPIWAAARSSVQKGWLHLRPSNKNSNLAEPPYTRKRSLDIDYMFSLRR